METEATLKSKLMREIKLRLPHYVAMRHEDVRTSGIPDISLDGERHGSWWEAKYDDDDGFKSTGIQELTMLRLAKVNCARYIVWQEKKGVRRTLVVHPEDLATLRPEAQTSGFDMAWLVDAMRRTHAA